jgi:peptidoglycan/LPS O-acetylase OafA/YrhL
MQIALHQKTIVYRDFLRNRVLRILPLFLTIFLVATSIGRDTFQPQDLLYMFATNLGHAPTSGTPVTGAAWTISLEFLFYMVFPFLARFAMERGPRYLLNLLVLMVFFKLAAYTVNENSTLMLFCTFVGRFDQFLIGMLAAMLIQRHRVRLQALAPWLLLVAGALVVYDTAAMHRIAPFGATPRHQLWIWWSLVESSGWALFIVAWVSFAPRLPGLRRACAVPRRQDQLFLLPAAHGPAAPAGPARRPRGRPGAAGSTGNGWLDALAIMIVAAYALTWALATLSYNTIEEPFLRMRRRYGHRQAGGIPG